MEPNTGDSLQAQQDTFDWSSLNKEDLEELQRLLDTHTFGAVEVDSGKLWPSYEGKDGTLGGVSLFLRFSIAV